MPRLVIAALATFVAVVALTYVLGVSVVWALAVGAVALAVAAATSRRTT